MTNETGSRRDSLISAVAMTLSAAVLLSGVGLRTRASAYDVNSDTATVQLESAAGIGRSADIPQLLTEEYSRDTNMRSRQTGIALYIDGTRYSGKTFLYRDTTYVGIREFTGAIAGANITWNEKTSTATAKTAAVTVTATKGKEYISANGRYLWAKTGIIIREGTMYVPVRPLAAAYGATVEWDAGTRSVKVKKGSGAILSGSKYYNADEVYWLSKIINAESRGEPMLGKIAVGNVVLNRVRSKDYPNTIYGVIFDRKYGVQFSPVSDGSIHLEPDADSVIAAKLCLEGYTVSKSILFFINPKIATSMWVTTSRPFEVSIGRHDFYA